MDRDGVGSRRNPQRANPWRGRTSLWRLAMALAVTACNWEDCGSTPGVEYTGRYVPVVQPKGFADRGIKIIAIEIGPPYEPTMTLAGPATITYELDGKIGYDEFVYGNPVP